jgi:hypothetical protein
LEHCFLFTTYYYKWKVSLLAYWGNGYGKFNTQQNNAGITDVCKEQNAVFCEKKV